MANSDAQKQLISKLEEVYSKAPNLPKEWIPTMVMLAPWIALIFGVLGILTGLSLLGIMTAFSPVVLMGGGAVAYGGAYLSGGLTIASSALMLAAYQGLKAGKASGWNLLFWSEIVGAITSVVTFALGGLVGTAVGLYILFQIKSHYK